MSRQKNIVLQSCQHRLLQGFLCTRSASGFLCKACCLAGNWDYTGSMEQFSYFPSSERSCSSFSKILPSESVLQGSALFSIWEAFLVSWFTFALKAPQALNHSPAPSPTHPPSTHLSSWLYLQSVSVLDFQLLQTCMLNKAQMFNYMFQSVVTSELCNFRHKLEPWASLGITQRSSVWDSVCPDIKWTISLTAP